MNNVREILDYATTWVREAAAVALSFAGVAVGRRKADRSWVTQADEEIERLLIARISEYFPTHGVLAEESGALAADREFVWVLDPIDGTRSFVSGLPLWSISVGLLQHGQPLLGVVMLPQLNDCYTALRGQGAWLNDLPIQVREPRAFDSEDWMAIPSAAHRRFRNSFPGKGMALGSIASELCYVARGSAVAALVGRCRIWDLAAGLVIVSEAGGTTRYLSGTPLIAAELLNGAPIREPLLVGHPEIIPALREHVTYLAG